MIRLPGLQYAITSITAYNVNLYYILAQVAGQYWANAVSWMQTTYLHSRNVVSSAAHTTRKAMTDPIADTVAMYMVWETAEVSAVVAVVITVMPSLE